MGELPLDRCEVFDLQPLLKVGYLSTSYHTALLLIGNGWADQALQRRVNWQLYATGPDIVAAFSGGKLDIAYIGLTPAMIAVDKGVPISCVAGGHVEGTVFVSTAQFASLAELGDDMPAALSQFRGKSIGCPKRGSIHDVILRHALGEAGLDNAVAVRNFAAAELIPEAMVEGVVAAAVGTPSLFSYMGLFGDYFRAKIIILPPRLWPYNPSYGIVVTREMKEREPQTVEGFIRVHERATAYIRREPRSAARTVAEVLELVDQEYVLTAYRLSPKYCAALPDAYIRSTLRFVPLLRGLGYLGKELKADEIFDLRFIGNVHPEPPHYEETVQWAAGSR
jgi:NitT/TauT family transport system substrate-binding protein